MRNGRRVLFIFKSPLPRLRRTLPRERGRDDRGERKNVPWRIFIVAVGVLAGSCLVWSREPGAAFLTLSPSVRSEALGFNSVVATGAEAMGVNPAFLSPPSLTHVYASYATLWDASYAHAAAARHLAAGPWSFGLGITTLRSDSLTDRDGNGAAIGTSPGSQDVSALGGMSYQRSPPWRFGVAGRLFRSSIGRVQSGTALSLDGGVAYVGNAVTASLGLNHLGPGQKFKSRSDPLPTLFRADAGLRAQSFLWLASTRYDVVRNQTLLGLGVEYRWNLLALRGGYNRTLGGPEDFGAASATDKLVGGLGMGLGIALGKQGRLDYSFRQPNDEWDGLHRVALQWAWGTVPKPSARPQRKAPRGPQRSPDRKKDPSKKFKLGHHL